MEGKLFGRMQPAAELMVHSDRLPDISKVRTERQFEQLWASAPYQGYDEDVLEHFAPYYRCLYIKEKGNELYKAGKYEDAIAQYIRAMRAHLGKDFVLPCPTFLNETYLTLEGVPGLRRTLDLTTCCNNIAQCYIKLGETTNAVDWLQEVEILFRCYIILLGARPEWTHPLTTVLERFTMHMKARQRTLHLFRSLGNTATAYWYGFKARDIGGTCTHTQNNDAIMRILREIEGDVTPLTNIRHPEPTMVDDWEVSNKELQVRGHWKRIVVDGEKPSGRASFASFYWKERFYVFGGNQRGKGLRDCWYLELSSMKWHRLPDLQEGRSPSTIIQRCMREWKNNAYLFTGSKKLWMFNLEEERWRQIETEFRGGDWPYRLRNELVKYSAEVFEGKLYVFGGDDFCSRLGTNTFMVLDLSTFRWELISGTMELQFKTNEPNVRVYANFWLVPMQRRFYLYSGYATRSDALEARKPQGGIQDFTYDDFWSFDIDRHKWTRERLRGNFISPRGETACAFNGNLDRAVVFGGYCPTTWMVDAQNVLTSFPFYGDSFLFNPKSKLWQQVVTKGFPSYRKQAHLWCDPETGKIYLFGGKWSSCERFRGLLISSRDNAAGHANSNFAATKHQSARNFSDLWQLTLDMEGGHLDPIDLQKDNRAETMGRWMRCFACGNIGTDWKKCAGTCKGQYFFCSIECQKDGWKEHKDAHGCRKV